MKLSLQQIKPSLRCFYNNDTDILEEVRKVIDDIACFTTETIGLDVSLEDNLNSDNQQLSLAMAATA